MKGFKRIIFPAILALLCLAINVSSQENREEILKLEAEFGTQTYYFKKSPEQLTFLEGSPESPVVPIPSGSGSDFWSSFDHLVDGIAKASNTYSKIVDAFKSKNTSEFKQILEGKGFEHFAATGQVKVTKGLRPESLDKYINNLTKLIKVPENHIEAITGVLSEIEFAEKNLWNNYKTAFDIGQENLAKFCSIYTYRDETKNVYDVVYLDFQGTFRLAKNTMIVRQNFSLLGGIWSDEKDVLTQVDQALTKETLDEVFNFFTILSFKGLGDIFGIKFEFPKF